MEAMLESLKYPLDQMIDFAIEYTNPSNYEALLEGNSSRWRRDGTGWVRNGTGYERDGTG